MEAFMSTTSDRERRIREFEQDGFTVARGFFTAKETERMRADIEHCTRANYEPAALSTDGIIYTGAVFKYCEYTRQRLAEQRVIDFVSPIAGGDLWVAADQAVTKLPNAGIFCWHQDNGYNHLRRPHFQLWIALTQTRKQNGALLVAPGSHKRGMLPHKFVGRGQVEVQAPIGDTVCIDADIGDVIFFSSLLLHCTGRNLADSERVAYVAEYMPLSDYVWYSKPPYFIAAEDGKSAPRFEWSQRGARSVTNQLTYLAPRVRRQAKAFLKPIRDVLRA
jgi:hypothetical protein